MKATIEQLNILIEDACNLRDRIENLENDEQPELTMAIGSCSDIISYLQDAQ